MVVQRTFLVVEPDDDIPDVADHPAQYLSKGASRCPGVADPAAFRRDHSQPAGLLAKRLAVPQTFEENEIRERSEIPIIFFGYFYVRRNYQVS